MNTLFKTTIAATLFLFTSYANALVIEISDTEDFSGTVVSVDDSSDTGADGIDDNGLVVIISPLGSFTFNVSSGFASSGDIDTLDLNSLNVTSGDSGTIYIRLTETGFWPTQYTSGYQVNFGGTTGGTVQLQSYADLSNAAFGTGILLLDTGSIDTSAYSGSTSGSFSTEGPYSLSIFATITHDGAATTSFDNEIKVPEPGTLTLLGLGLMGMGMARRRKA